MADIIQMRRDIAANWTSVNPTLADGEWGFEKDTGKLKIGNGTDNWATLAYLFNGNTNYEVIDLSSVSTATINWTTTRQNKFGDFPVTEVWVNDGGSIYKSSFQPSVDAAPPSMTVMSFDFGGSISGFIIIK